MTDENLPEFEFPDDLENEFKKMQEEAAASAEAQSDNAVASSPAPVAEGETQMFAWQVGIADMKNNALMNADDYPNYLINREPITQMLGIAMASGQNAYQLDNTMFVAAVSVPDGNGGIRLIDASYPGYQQVAAIISEQLIKGEDKGMVAALPNGMFMPVKQPIDPSKL